MRLEFANRVLILTLLFLAGVLPCRSDSLHGGFATNWNPNYLYGNNFGNIVLPYYWNNNSGEGNQANVGWCLVGSAQCGMQNPPGYIPYYSNGALGAPTDMYFTSSGSPIQVTLQLSLTTQKGSGFAEDLFGYYITDATGTAIVNPTPIFTTNYANGSTFTLSTLSTGQNYGFFIENIQGIGSALPERVHLLYELRREYSHWLNAG